MPKKATYTRASDRSYKRDQHIQATTPSLHFAAVNQAGFLANLRAIWRLRNLSQ
jgi:hypothetical protein